MKAIAVKRWLLPVGQALLKGAELYVNSMSRIAGRIMPVEPFQSWLIGLLCAPLVIVATVLVLASSSALLGFLLTFVHPLLQAAWPEPFWAQVLASTALTVSGFGIFGLVWAKLSDGS